MEGDYLILWQNDNTIVIGQNQNSEEEINRSFVEAHQIHVVRRSTGGGAVYHDLGNLNYSFITDAGEDIRKRRWRHPNRPSEPPDCGKIRILPRRQQHGIIHNIELPMEAALSRKRP